MTFSDYSHKDFVPDFNGDEYTANAVLRKDGWDYYELSYEGVKRASDYLDETNDDFQKSMNAMNDDGINLRKEDNPAVRIFSYKPEYDEDGDMQPSYECVFHGTLEEAKQDERFKNFDIENNVRKSEIKLANQQDFENLYAQENTQNQENSQEFTQENVNSQSQNQENSRTKAQEQTQENNESQRKENYSNFEKRQLNENALNDYDTMLENNKDLNDLHNNRDLNDKLDEEIEKNNKDILDKELEIKKRQEALDEQERQKNRQKQFNSQETDDKDPLAQMKKELQDLKEKKMALKDQKAKCEQEISECVGKIASANDVYEVYKNLIEMYRKLKESSNINKNIKYNDEKAKELEEKIKGYTKNLNEILKKVGATKEGKELIDNMTKDLHEAQKESKAERQILKKEYEFHQNLDILFKQRQNTTNLNRNTDEIEKLMKKIQKETPNFEKNYNTSFKQAMGIIKEREQGKTKTQTQTQYQGRSA